MLFIFECLRVICLLFLYGYCIHALFSLVLVARGVYKRRAFVTKSQESSGTDLFLLVQVPIYNEAPCIPGLMKSLLGLQWEADKICIQILDDSDDETTDLIEQWLEMHPQSRPRFVHVRRGSREGFKAGALAEGLNRCKGAELCLILDADFWPEEDFGILLASHLMRYPELSMVQARWVHRNEGESWLTRTQSVAIDTHFALEQPMRAWNGYLMNFNGTAGMWRVQAIQEVGGWSFATLTEDLELSYRAQLSGKIFDYVEEVTCSAELPQTYKALRNQQFRWAKGSLQTAKLMIPRLLREGPLNLMTRLQGVMHLFHYLTQPILALYIYLLLYLPKPDSLVIPFIAPLFLTPFCLYIFAAYRLGKPIVPVVVTFPSLFILGLSMSIPLLRAAAEAFSQHPSDFVRTPKAGGSFIFYPSCMRDRIWQLIEVGFWMFLVLGIVGFLGF